MAALSGTYADRITYDTNLLPQRQWWMQTDDVAGFPAGPYLWENGVWGYFGDAGSDAFGQVLIEGAEYPPLRARRLTNVTTGGRNSLALVAKTSGDMQDGFGGGLRVGIQDGSMSSASDIAEFGAVRDGVDNRGKAYISAFGGGLGDGSLSLDYNGLVETTFRGDGTNGVLRIGGDKIAQPFPVTVQNTVTETTLFLPGSSKTFPAGWFYAPGRLIEGKVLGFFSTTGTPTLRLRVKLGGLTILDTGIGTLAGTISQHLWKIEFILFCQSIGVTGNISGAGEFKYDNAAHAGATWGMPSSSGVTIDTTAEMDLEITAQWGTASINNTLTNTVMRISATR